MFRVRNSAKRSSYMQESVKSALKPNWYSMFLRLFAGVSCSLDSPQLGYHGCLNHPYVVVVLFHDLLVSYLDHNGKRFAELLKLTAITDCSSSVYLNFCTVGLD